MTHELAGKRAPAERWINVPRLVTSYFASEPDPEAIEQQVRFGTSGHRGSALRSSFNEHHVLAITQAVCESRASRKVDGPLYVGIDTHALSEPALVSTLEVLAAQGVSGVIQEGGGFTPTPVVSHAIVSHNRGRTSGLADGIVITPSHNPPEDGGFKYNPPSGGPADASMTSLIQDRANELLRLGARNIERVPYKRARAAMKAQDFIQPYVDDLDQALDMQAIAGAGLSLGADPMGGSGVAYWGRIAERYGLNLEVVNREVDARFAFMPVDRDGKIRMDCSSRFAMAGLIDLKDRFDVAFGNDPDFDRHGIVTRGAGLMNPNHYLAVAIEYLFGHRPDWSEGAAIGKTLVSSSMIDRVAKELGRPLREVPVGFKWFVEGLASGAYGFGGEESAGASFLRRDGSVWTTDKDGILLALLAAEITAVTQKDPGEHYAALQARFGDPVYERIDAPASRAQKAVLKKLAPDDVSASTLAGEEILAKLTRAPGNDASIGGLKVVTENGWFAARPSGTEEIYKIYAESFLGAEHLTRIQEEAKAIVSGAFESAGV